VTGILLFIIAALAAEAPQFQLDTVGGPPATGALVELSAQHVVLKTADGNRDFKLAEVRRIGRKESAANPTVKLSTNTVWVQTLDGSRFSAISYEVTKGQARLKLSSGDMIELPTRMIRQVEFPAIGSVSGWPVAAKDATADMIVVRKKDIIEKNEAPKQSLDPVDGVLGDVTADVAHFTVDGESVSVKRAKIAGLIYFHPADAAAEIPEPVCTVQDESGWQLNAKSVKLVDGRLQIATSFGTTITRPLSAIAAIDFSASRVLYLSDMQSESAEWSPYIDNAESGKQADALAQFYRPRRDRGFDGGPLSVAGKTYKKGLALASRTEMEYKLAGKGRRFQAIAGIDDAVRKQGNVRLAIIGDGKTLYDGKLTGRDEPAPLDIDVAAVKRLKIVVDFGGGLDAGNYLDLCDARIVK